MNRRNFLLDTGQSALIASLGLKPDLLKAGSDDGDLLVAEVEKLIPRIMTESKIPGVSAAIVKDFSKLQCPERKSGFALLTNSDTGGYLLYNEELGNVIEPALYRSIIIWGAACGAPNNLLHILQQFLNGFFQLLIFTSGNQPGVIFNFECGLGLVVFEPFSCLVFGGDRNGAPAGTVG